MSNGGKCTRRLIALTTVPKVITKAKPPSGVSHC